MKRESDIGPREEDLKRSKKREQESEEDSEGSEDEGPTAYAHYISKDTGWEWYVVGPAENMPGYLFGLVVGEFPELGVFEENDLKDLGVIQDYDFAPGKVLSIQKDYFSFLSKIKDQERKVEQSHHDATPSLLSSTSPSKLGSGYRSLPLNHVNSCLTSNQQQETEGKALIEEQKEGSSTKANPSPLSAAPGKAGQIAACRFMADCIPELKQYEAQLVESVEAYYRAKALGSDKTIGKKTVMSDDKLAISGTSDASKSKSLKESTAARSPNFVYVETTIISKRCDDLNHKVYEYPSKSFNLCHADKQLATYYHKNGQPIPPLGDSRAMCPDCQNFYFKEAAASGRPLFVTDPYMTRLFLPDGSVVKIFHADVVNNDGVYDISPPTPSQADWPGKGAPKPKPVTCQKNTAVFEQRDGSKTGYDQQCNKS